MITGYFTKIDIPQVRAGETLKATIGYYALNPGAWYWKTFIIAHSPGVFRKLVSATREIGQEGRGEHTYTLGTMPNTNINISFFLFAHDDASYDWNWEQYQAWMDWGSIPAATHLASEYRFGISPGEPLPPEVDLKVLKYQILGESAGGSITFDPPALDYEGHYYKGTVVSLTAIVNLGYVFVKWRGEVDNELSTSLYNTVTMSENRLVKAEFGLEVVEKFYPLEVDITPTGSGYVTTVPPPIDITNYFINGTVGKFSEGIRVMVTAHPNSGYIFDHWSDEIQGGVSYSQTEWVSGSMTEHKAVKAHFRAVDGPPPDNGEPPISCLIDAECPEGYVCRNGVCVRKEEELNWWWLIALAGAAIIFLPKPKKKPEEKTWRR